MVAAFREIDLVLFLQLHTRRYLPREYDPQDTYGRFLQVSSQTNAGQTLEISHVDL
jgi:hypothetical protein